MYGTYKHNFGKQIIYRMIEHRISVADMIMLRQMSELIREDKMRNESTKFSIEVVLKVDNIGEYRLRQLRHVQSGGNRKITFEIDATILIFEIEW